MKLKKICISNSDIPVTLRQVCRMKLVFFFHFSVIKVIEATFSLYRSNFRPAEKFVLTEPFNILALFIRECRTVIFPSKVSNNTTRKSMFAISVRNFLACSQTLYFLFKVLRARVIKKNKATLYTGSRDRLVIFLSFSSCVTTHPCSHAFADKKNLAGHGFHTLPFKFSTVPVKTLTSILTFKFLNVLAFKFLCG